MLDRAGAMVAFSLLVPLLASPPLIAVSPGQPTSSMRIVTLESGSTIEVEAGQLDVPESRRRPGPRRVTIPYYRLRSLSPSSAAPIFLLAGGPGASWIDRFVADETFREVAFYRTIADVVLFDQRGGGHALPALDCPETSRLEPDRPIDLGELRGRMRAALAACRDRWRRQGVDLAAYNTVENAADVDDLRRALGYDKVTLVGGSYGSHLALAVMRAYPQAVERAVLFGVEGPDHTWDDPGAMLRTLERIAARAESLPELAGRIPAGGLLGALARVEARLDAAPQRVQVENEGRTTTVVIDGVVIRRLARSAAGKRSAPGAWPEMILALDRGDYSRAARGKLDNQTVGLADPVHYSMDCASGISPERRRRYAGDPARSLLGDINFEYEALCDVWPSEDLGEAFRADVRSEIPTLIVHGTWDLSTPIENAREVAASLRHAQLVEVIGGSHGALYNLYERWPPMHDLMRSFLSGQPVDFPATVSDLPDSPAAPAPAGR